MARNGRPAHELIGDKLAVVPPGTVLDLGCGEGPTLATRPSRGWNTVMPARAASSSAMRTDPALALTGRRCVPRRLLDAGFTLDHPTFAEAVSDLLIERFAREASDSGPGPTRRRPADDLGEAN